MAAALVEMGIGEFLRGVEASHLQRGISCSAEFDGAIAFFSAARPVLQALLPRELVLAEVGDQRQAHPFLVVFGSVRNAAPRVAGLRVPASMAYKECLLAIPFVHHRGGVTLHSYVPGMFCDSLWPVLLGNAYFGFSKHQAEIRSHLESLMVNDVDGRALLALDVSPSDTWSAAPTGEIPGFGWMRRVLALPVLGMGGGRLIGSRFGWSFERSRARSASATLSVSVSAEKQMVAGSHFAPHGAAFEVSDARWCVSWPGKPGF